MTTSINVQFVKKSSNKKIGAIPCTTSDRNSCPPSCPFLGDGGCYAEAGYYTRMNWDKVTSGERGGDWQSLCESVSKLPEGQIWRHNVAGDLPHVDGLIDKSLLFKLVKANMGKMGFTYTHHDPKMGGNALTIRIANITGFTVNLSADSPEHADQLADLTIAGKQIAPVVTVIPADQTENSTTPAGRTIVVCPAAIKADVSCKTCKLCARSDRRVIVGFPAHGIRKDNAQRFCA